MSKKLNKTIYYLSILLLLTGIIIIFYTNTQTCSSKIIKFINKTNNSKKPKEFYYIRNVNFSCNNILFYNYYKSKEDVDILFYFDKNFKKIDILDFIKIFGISTKNKIISNDPKIDLLFERCFENKLINFFILIERNKIKIVRGF